LGLVLLLVCSPLLYWSYREAHFRYSNWKFSREFKPGMHRQNVEDRLSRDGIVWGQNIRLDTDIIDLGEIRYSFVCGPTAVSIWIEYVILDPPVPSGADPLVNIKLVRQDSGCM
jgi:hypothetical protein